MKVVMKWMVPALASAIGPVVAAACTATVTLGENQPLVSKRICLEQDAFKIVVLTRPPQPDSIYVFAEVATGGYECTRLPVKPSEDPLAIQVGPYRAAGCYTLFYRL